MKMTMSVDGCSRMRSLLFTMEDAEWFVGVDRWRVSQSGAEECMWMDFDVEDSVPAMYRFAKLVTMRTKFLSDLAALDDDEEITHLRDKEDGHLLTFGLLTDVTVGETAESIFALCGRDIDQEVCCEDGELMLHVWVENLDDAEKVAAKVVESKSDKRGYGLFDVFTDRAYADAQNLIKSIKIEKSLKLHEEALKKLEE